jgi:hypothetical protein
LPSGKSCVTVKKYSLGYCKIPYTIFEEPELKLNGNALSDLFNLSPNPTANTFSITSKVANLFYDEVLTVEVSNLAGDKVLTTTSKVATPISVSQLPSGIYFVNISIGEKISFNEKLIKIK